MMRADVKTVLEDMTVEAFRLQYPLGSTERAIAVDKRGRYAGIVLVAEAHQPLSDHLATRPATIERLLKYKDRFLLPGLNVADAAAMFEKTNSDELAVLDNLGTAKWSDCSPGPICCADTQQSSTRGGRPFPRSWPE